MVPAHVEYVMISRNCTLLNIPFIFSSDMMCVALFVGFCLLCSRLIFMYPFLNLLDNVIADLFFVEICLEPFSTLGRLEKAKSCLVYCFNGTNKFASKPEPESCQRE